MGKKKRKKNPLNPYILSEMEEGDQRIGSLVDQGQSISITIDNTRQTINENDSGLI